MVPYRVRSGLVAAEEADQPFEYCDVVSTTTHKSLRGPRAGMIFFRRVRRPALRDAAATPHARPGFQSGSRDLM